MLSVQRAEETRLLNATKKGSIAAVNRLATLLQHQRTIVERFPNVIPVLLGCLAARPPTHEDAVIDWSKDDIHTIHFQIACFQCLVLAFYTCHRFPNDNMSTEARVVSEQWSGVSQWMVFFVDQTVDEYIRDGPEVLERDEPGRFEVWFMLWGFIREFHRTMRTVDQAEILWSNPNYIRAVFRLWISQAHHIQPHIVDINDQTTDHFIYSTISVGLLFSGKGEPSYNDIIAELPHFIPYMEKPLLIALRSKYPDLQLLTTTLALLSETNFEPISIRTRDNLVGTIMKCIRHVTLRIPLEHHITRTTIGPSIRCAGITLLRLIAKQHPVHTALYTQLLHSGLFPVLHRLTYLNSCPCRADSCPWTTCYFDISTSAWSKIIDIIPLVIVQTSSVALYHQLRRGLRWVEWDMRRCQAQEAGSGAVSRLRPKQWKSWNFVLSTSDEAVRGRAMFEESAQKLCCGPQCNSAPIPVKDYRICAGCDGPVYCSRSCQKAHWVATHQEECHPPNNSITQYPSTQSTIDLAFREWLKRAN